MSTLVRVLELGAITRPSARNRHAPDDEVLVRAHVAHELDIEQIARCLVYVRIDESIIVIDFIDAQVGDGLINQLAAYEPHYPDCSLVEILERLLIAVCSLYRNLSSRDDASDAVESLETRQSKNCRLQRLLPLAIALENRFAPVT